MSDDEVTIERLNSSSCHLGLIKSRNYFFRPSLSSVGKSLVTEAKLPRDHDNGNDQLVQGFVTKLPLGVYWW